MWKQFDTYVRNDFEPLLDTSNKSHYSRCYREFQCYFNDMMPKQMSQVLMFAVILPSCLVLIAIYIRIYQIFKRMVRVSALLSDTFFYLCELSDQQRIQRWTGQNWLDAHIFITVRLLLYHETRSTQDGWLEDSGSSDYCRTFYHSSLLRHLLGSFVHYRCNVLSSAPKSLYRHWDNQCFDRVKTLQFSSEPLFVRVSHERVQKVPQTDICKDFLLLRWFRQRMGKSNQCFLYRWYDKRV